MPTKMEAFIAEQPQVVSEALQAGLDCRPPWKERSAVHLFLVGSGSSRHALLAVQGRFESASTMPHVIGPTEFIERLSRGLPEGSAAIVLSQIGTSATSVVAARRAAESGLDVLVLTAERESPIARLSLPTLFIPAAGETIGPKTKGYAGSVAALLGLSPRRAAMQAFRPEDYREFLARSRNAAARLAEEADGLDFLLFAGSGAHYATALESSLKVAEVAGLPTAAFPIEETLHGRLHGLGPLSLAIFIVAGEAEGRTARHAAEVMRERGVRALLVNLGREPSPFDWPEGIITCPADLQPVYAIAPAQWLAFELATRRGMSPDTMRYPDLSRALAIKLN
ncbi:SIS domain-containing protein [Chelativorans sp. J32]|uniref:SIS domain-containing protein n=1 Tax=Chelativorans sp. J32 TaxID=935840 RepID=UPI0004805709|nr:SIS domain-containing protein [Chelativorans sp. J32]